MQVLVGRKVSRGEEGYPMRVGRWKVEVGGIRKQARDMKR